MSEEGASESEMLAYAEVRVYAKKFVNGQASIDQLRAAIKRYERVIAAKVEPPEAA